MAIAMTPGVPMYVRPGARIRSAVLTRDRKPDGEALANIIVSHQAHMFTRVEARRFRSLKAVEQNVGAFRALVGPNGSGKTTFLDVIALLGDLMRNRGDVRKTVFDRSFNYQKLLWLEHGADFQLALEAEIPDDVRASMAEDKQIASMRPRIVSASLRVSKRSSPCGCSR